MPYEFFVCILILVLQHHPARLHDAVAFLTKIVSVAIQLQFAGLHVAFLIEVIILAVDVLPFGNNGFAVASIIIPEGFRHLVVPVILIGDADPLVADTFSILIHVILVHHGGTGYIAVFI